MSRWQEKLGIGFLKVEHDMKQGFNKLKAFWQDESGATSIEYCMIAAFIALAMIASLQILAGDNGGLWGSNANQIGNAMGGGTP